MSRNNYYKSSIKLPQNAQDFIDLIIKSMRYRKKIRLEVQRELAAHFEDELRDCTDDKQKEDRAEQLIEQFGDAKLLGILLRRAKKRCRPLWRTVAARTFQTIGVFILCIIFYAFYISMGRPTVNIDYLQKATNMVRPLADESQNAANLYNQAIAIYVKPPEVAKDSLQFTDSNEPKDDLLIVISKKNSVDELTETEFELLNKWINENSQAIDLYIQASKKPYCWWNRQFDNEKESLLGIAVLELSSIRQISRLVLWRSRLNFYQSDIDGAFEDLFTLYRTGGLFKGPRTLIEQWVGIAIQDLAVHDAFEIIDSKQMDEQMLQTIWDEFQILVNNCIFQIDFTCEIFVLMDFIQRAYTDNGRGSGRMTPIGLQEYITTNFEGPIESSYFFALGVSLISPNRAKITEMVEYLYDSYDELAQFTPFSRRQMNIDAELDIEQWPRIKQIRYWPFMFMVPPYNQVLRLSYRIQADSEALLTVLALQRYKLQYGQYPETLDALVQAKLLEKIPIDPFSDNAFVYRVIGEDFILYSVGQNFTDDGGQIYRYKDGEVRLWAEEGDAVFWPVQK